MIEAVNSTIAAATLVRALPEQAVSGQSVAASQVQAQKAAPTAPYVSPYISVNVVYDKAVLQLRNGDTGEVETQFPSENQLRAYQRAQAEARRTGEQARRPTQAEVRTIAPSDVSIVANEVDAPEPAAPVAPASVETESATTQSAPVETTSFSTEA